jgi:PKD repeat protein
LVAERLHRLRGDESADRGRVFVSGGAEVDAFNPDGTLTGTIAVPGGAGGLVVTASSFVHAPPEPAISVDHTFAAPGTYQVQVTATDDQGAVGTTITLVHVQAASPG